MSKMQLNSGFTHGRRIVLLIAATVLLAGPACAGDITPHASGHYFQDASGKPFFMLGYYAWGSVDPNSSDDHDGIPYADMITQGSAYKLNYIRISLGINRYDDGVNPPTHVPYVYVGDKCDLDQWDQVFWDGVHYHCQLARQHGVNVHLAIFDGCQLRYGTEYWRWDGSFWNIDNQIRSFYGDIDVNDNGTADEDGDFYRIDDFNNNTGLGYYQRLVIDKTIAETAQYDNVFYEIGNELLSARRDWYTTVAAYVQARTGKAITQNMGLRGSGIDGFSTHYGDTPADVKSRLEGMLVGTYYPLWIDPDGSSLEWASSVALERAAWYSFTGGAAGWGGFSLDLFEGKYDTTTTSYYMYLAQFIQDSGIRFWEMTPQHNLVGNSAENSCLANAGSEYVAYAPNDHIVSVDLTAVSGDAAYTMYSTRTGEWVETGTVAGGAWQTFERPPQTSGWVIHITVP